MILILMFLCHVSYVMCLGVCLARLNMRPGNEGAGYVRQAWQHTGALGLRGSHRRGEFRWVLSLVGSRVGCLC